MTLPSPKSYNVDWLAELQLPEFPFLDEAAPVPDLAQVSSILLTGATGFLGVFLLYELLEQFAPSHVFCLVRDEDQKHALSRIQIELEKCLLWKEDYKNRITIV